ncbi:MAG: hypothetical protein J7494_06575 [Sphingobium sp.]|nr:hypothetical protein [Sphingobium sp.]
MVSGVRRSLLGAAMTGVASLAFAMPVQAGNPTQNVLPVNCDRACLASTLTAVLDAMVAKDISKLPLGNDVVSTQNGVKMRLDDGVWQVTDALSKYRVDFIDPESGQAGTYATVMYGGKLAILAVRIATWEQKIQEIEIIVSQGNGGGPMGDSGKQVEATGAPRAQLNRSIPEKERMSREELIRIADSYFANLQGSTGKTTAPFAPTCLRLENGFQTNLVKAAAPPPSAPASSGNAGGAPSAAAAVPARPAGPNIFAMTCEDQQKSGFFPFVTSIRDRRFPVVDREKGIVMAFGFFDHSGTVSPTNRNPNSFMMSESFQIDRGKIDQVEAVMASVPYKMRNEVWREGDHRVNPIGLPTGK